MIILYFTKSVFYIHDNYTTTVLIDYYTTVKINRDYQLCCLTAGLVYVTLDG